MQDGFIDTSEMKTVRVLRSEIARFTVQPGDVLLTEGGDFDKLGRGAMWDGHINPCLSTPSTGHEDELQLNIVQIAENQR